MDATISLQMIDGVILGGFFNPCGGEPFADVDFDSDLLVVVVVFDSARQPTHVVIVVRDRRIFDRSRSVRDLDPIAFLEARHKGLFYPPRTKVRQAFSIQATDAAKQSLSP